MVPNRLKMSSRSSSCVTGLSLHTKSTFSGGARSASGKSPSISRTWARLAAALAASASSTCRVASSCQLGKEISEAIRVFSRSNHEVITEYSGTQGGLREYSGSNQGVLREYSGSTQGVIREYSGSTQGLLREPNPSSSELIISAHQCSFVLIGAHRCSSVWCASVLISAHPYESAAMGTSSAVRPSASVSSDSPSARRSRSCLRTRAEGSGEASGTTIPGGSSYGSSSTIVCRMRMFWYGRPLASAYAFDMARATSRPSVTSPKSVYRSSRCVWSSATVMKNCDPLAFGRADAIDTQPAFVCRSFRCSSSSK
ncbi:hypothetical protein Ctob_003644 [Chrysochromulina tobinii]|uniref:Uncharacterized protein n=1 Tax=Chrysochromulina tobinii TaxID=1460289 RepID=A0A0M0JJ79_9EUKA|nr:hypothetical protein Ctob_003644 [Chrysochromulina tobinii]|eukprot:KOO26525.1 hypothetical protein Ctob_003644 [Chrysochromulina sp. CCMP291]